MIVNYQRAIPFSSFQFHALLQKQKEINVFQNYVGVLVPYTLSFIHFVNIKKKPPGLHINI